MLVLQALMKFLVAVPLSILGLPFGVVPLCRAQFGF
jgi:hypothetical protein